MTKKQKLFILYPSILLFLVSLFFPAFYIDRADYDGWANSFGLLIIGWSGALYGGAATAWIANPFIFLAWFRFFKNLKYAILFSGIATFFAVSFLFYHTIIANEAGGFCVITDRKAGYWFWLSSISLFFISTIVTFIRTKGRSNNQHENYNH